MKLGSSITRFCVAHPIRVTVAVSVFTFVLLALAVLPSLWPDTFSFLSPVRVDTDPENMLPATEEVRVFHNRMMKEMI